MLKLFFNDRYIALTSCYEECFSTSDSIVYTVQLLKEIPVILDQFLTNNQLAKLYVYTGNLTEDNVFAIVSSSFRSITAAGGLVRNMQNEVLMIYRFNHWDLPKGKHEDSETIEQAAIREVEEECGLNEPIMVKPIIKTYHIYEQNNARILKETHWFEMLYKKDTQPKPQTEEGVEKAIWVPQSELQVYLNSAYPSIREVFKAIS